MNRRQDAGRRLYEACWSGSVPTLDSLIEEDQFILDRVSSLTGFFNDTPLHLAALRGHLDFTKALLTRKPKLATELDSLRCSPLHLASAEGHVEVVQALLRVNIDVCVARDQDSRIPLHLAAMKGRVEIIRELLDAKPNSIHEKLSKGETVFHLCVKYNRLEALKALVQYVQSNGMESLLNSRDDDGNTILHLVATLKQMDREDVGRRLYEACLSGSVPALDALIEEDQLVLDRISVLTGFFNDTPLHVAALRGHLDFTKALLIRKPKLASELDSLRCSPLHLASTEGHVEIVQELLRVNTDICIAHDQDGRISLHLAAMKGRVEVIQELLGARPNSIQEKLGKGETVMHLCVKYNKLEALKTLVKYVQSNGMESLLNSRDDDGNTILHLAATLKQMDTIEYLFGIRSVKDHANVENKNGFTVLDVVEQCPFRDLKTMEIREFLLQAGVRRTVCGGPYPNPESPPDNPPSLPPPPQCCCKAGVILSGCISRFWTKYIKVDPVWLREVRGHLITAATLTATMAYQSILSPPGGLWQENKDDHVAGKAILDGATGDDEGRYAYYFAVNSIVLIASLSTIMLAMTGFPIQNKLLTWLMIFTVYVTISCMATAYVNAVILVSPKLWAKLPEKAGNGVFYGWLGLVFFVLLIHSCRLLVWLGRMLVKLVKACYRWWVPRATRNNISTSEVNPAGRP